GRSVFGRLKTTGLPSRLVIFPPASSTSSAPAQMSHSFFGTKVKEASASPVAISDNLYAILPVGRVRKAPLKESHSPRLVSDRLDNIVASASRSSDETYRRCSSHHAPCPRTAQYSRPIGL